MQLLIVALTLFACLVYIARRIYLAVTVKAGDPCRGCQLRQSCSKYAMKANGVRAQRQNKPHHGRSDSPCNGCARRDNNDTVRQDTPPSCRHNET